jgi:hypothetical protein
VLPERDAYLSIFAFLIGLAAPELDPQPVCRLLEVLNVETDQLRAPEGAGEAEEKQRTIARPGERVRRTGRHHAA